MTPEVILQSKIICLACGVKKREIMSTNVCQWFYECELCHTVLKPTAGDCCVYCSYGTVPCPPMQLSPQNQGKGCSP